MKRDYEKAVKKSVSMPEIMLDEAEDRRRALRLSTLSDYIQMLIRKDTKHDEEASLHVLTA